MSGLLVPRRRLPSREESLAANDGYRPAWVFEEVDDAFRHDFYYEISIPANQAVLDTPLAVSTDADFYWRGIVLSRNPVTLGQIQVKFKGPYGNPLQDDWVDFQVYGSGPAFPGRFGEEIFCPSGSVIDFSAQESAGIATQVRVTLIGVKGFDLCP